MRTDRTKALPPFFTQVIGSLPRPKLVRDLIDRRDSMSAGEYTSIMDEMVVDIIQLDDPALTYLWDRRLTSEGQTHDDRLKREWDIQRQAPQAIAAVNRITADLPVEVHLLPQREDRI